MVEWEIIINKGGGGQLERRRKGEERRGRGSEGRKGSGLKRITLHGRRSYE